MPSTPVSRTLLALALSALVGLASAGCGDTETDTDPFPTGASSTGPPSTTSPTDPHDPTPTSESPQDDHMKVTITIGEQRFHATLSDSAAARDLLAQLPVTVEMTDHGGVEKTGALPSPLSLDGQADGADPDVGDLGYYAPGNDLVLYYGDQTYYPGIVILGRLDETAAQRISAMNGPVTATVEVSDG
jgi:hypothetical protein